MATPVDWPVSLSRTLPPGTVPEVTFVAEMGKMFVRRTQLYRRVNNSVGLLRSRLAGSSASTLGHSDRIQAWPVSLRGPDGWPGRPLDVEGLLRELGRAGDKARSGLSEESDAPSAIDDSPVHREPEILMAEVFRNYRYRTYPRRVQREAMDEILGLHRELWWYNLRFSAPEPIRLARITNTILFDVFHDQSNILRVVDFPEESRSSYYFAPGEETIEVTF